MCIIYINFTERRADTMPIWLEKAAKCFVTLSEFSFGHERGDSSHVMANQWFIHRLTPLVLCPFCFHRMDNHTKPMAWDDVKTHILAYLCEFDYLYIYVIECKADTMPLVINPSKGLTYKLIIGFSNFCDKTAKMIVLVILKT